MNLKRKTLWALVLTLSFYFVFVSSASAFSLFNRDVKKAKEFMLVGMYPQAIELLKKRITDTPTDAEAHFQLGICFLNMRSYSSAEERFLAALRLKPKYGPQIGKEYFKAASEELTKHNFPRAQAFFQKAVRFERSLQGVIARNMFDEGVAFLDRQNYDAAYKRFEIAAAYDINIRKQISEEYEKAGNIAFDSGEFSKAKRLYQKAVHFKPSSKATIAESILNKAKQCLDKHEYAAAKKRFQIALAIDGSLVSKVQKIYDSITIEMSDDELRNRIIDYYNNKSEWAGVFRMASILKIRVEKPNVYERYVHVKYKYSPIPGNRKGRKDSGVDQRIFVMKRIGRIFKVVKMLGHNSASF